MANEDQIPEPEEELDYPISREEVVKIKTRITAAIYKHKNEVLSHGEECKSYYKGQSKELKAQKLTELTDKEEVFNLEINYIKPHVDINVAALSVGEVEFIAQPEDEDCIDKAGQFTSVLNHIFRSINAARITKKALRDSKIYPFGVVGISWKFQLEDDSYIEHGRSEELLEEVSNELIGELPIEQQIKIVENSNGLLNGNGGIRTVDDIARELSGMFHSPFNENGGVDIEKSESDKFKESNIIYDDAEVFRISPRDFMIDPKATDATLCDARYVVHRVRGTIEEFKRNVRLKGLDDIERNKQNRYSSDPTTLSNLSASYQLNIVDVTGKPYLSNLKPEEEDDFDEITLYHYWDSVYRIHVVISFDLDRPLLSEKNPYKYYRNKGVSPFPFEIMPASEVPDEIYGISKTDELIPLQRELNYDRRIKALWKRRMLPLTWYMSSGLDDEAVAIIKRPELGNAIEVNTPNSIGVAAAPALPSEFWLSASEIKDDMSIISAVSELQRGELSSTRRSAREISYLSTQGSARGQDEQKEYEEFIRRVGVKVANMYQDERFADRNRTMIMFDPKTGTKVPFNFSAIECKGNFGIYIVVGSTLVKDRNYEKVSTQQLLPVLQPLFDAGILDPRPIIRDLLKSYDIPSLNEAIQPMEDKKVVEDLQKFLTLLEEYGILVDNPIISKLVQELKFNQESQAQLGQILGQLNSQQTVQNQQQLAGTNNRPSFSRIPTEISSQLIQ